MACIRFVGVHIRSIKAYDVRCLNTSLPETARFILQSLQVTSLQSEKLDPQHSLLTL